MSKLLKITAAVAAPVVAMSLMAAPASAQSRDRDNTGRNALIGAAVGGLAGAIYGNGDGRYIAGGALGGAAIGAVGAVIGTLGGAEVRGRLAARFGQDRPAALIEDAIAIGGALAIVALAR